MKRRVTYSNLHLPSLHVLILFHFRSMSQGMISIFHGSPTGTLHYPSLLHLLAGTYFLHLINFSFSTQLNPSGGVGGSNAIHDVIELANRINGLSIHSSVKDIDDAFKAYKAERIDWVNKAYDNSRVMVNLIGQVKRVIYLVLSGGGFAVACSL